MSDKVNKYYAIDYKLYTIFNGERQLEEETTAGDPFVFISGFGTTIPGFEKNIEQLSKGEEFDFVISKEDAYGDRNEEFVVELPKDVFVVNGHFDAAQVHVGAIIPLQNEDGNRFMGKVIEVGDAKVKVDLNHPLAGRELNFVGKVTECREATMEEIQLMINRLSGGGCHGGCGGCGGGGCSGGSCGGDGECNCDGNCDCNK